MQLAEIFMSLESNQTINKNRNSIFVLVPNVMHVLIVNIFPD